ncbi:MAG: Na(+)/H(+) antiporter subunit B [Desulfuromonadaceae bacterium]|nr:Na(+)/H(+) antiporter subunit B [Desulfuromonas sp.]MDY0185458.1 Na(+)/H(+) antiporter subunit B [Desulfuromonadaceae bacterium]
MELIIDITLLTFLGLTALAINRIDKLFCIIMLSGIYSLLCASLFVSMDAVDVAFTEAAVGTGIATVLLLSTIGATDTQQRSAPQRPLFALLVVCATGAILVYGTMDMPAFGDPDAPIHHHVAPRYLEMSQQEVGSDNIVTSILSSYRGFDTLGETVVIFTAGLSVVGLIGFRGMQKFGDRQRAAGITQDDMGKHLVLRIVIKMFIPLILLFALYVQFHGDFGPGGGFQAGVIFASGFIFYTLMFGLDAAMRVVSPRTLSYIAALGVLTYGGVGITTLLMGGNFLDYNVLRPDPLQGQHLGIFLIELGVGTTVFSIMVLIFFAFSSRKGLRQ